MVLKRSYAYPPSYEVSTAVFELRNGELQIIAEFSFDGIGEYTINMRDIELPSQYSGDNWELTPLSVSITPFNNTLMLENLYASNHTVSEHMFHDYSVDETYVFSIDHSVAECMIDPMACVIDGILNQAEVALGSVLFISVSEKMKVDYYKSNCSFRFFVTEDMRVIDGIKIEFYIKPEKKMGTIDKAGHCAPNGRYELRR